MLLVATHTKQKKKNNLPDRQTGEYILLVKKGGPEFASERRKWQENRLFPLDFRHKFYHVAEKVPRILDELVIRGEVLTSNMDLWSDRGFVGATVLTSVDHWSDKQAQGCVFFSFFSQKHPWDFHPVRVKGATMRSHQRMTLEKRGGGGGKKKKRKRGAQFSSASTERFLRLTERRQSD